MHYWIPKSLEHLTKPNSDHLTIILLSSYYHLIIILFIINSPHLISISDHLVF